MIVHDSFEIYKGRKGFINPSSFKSADINSPAVFEYEYNNSTDKDTVATLVGECSHCLVLTHSLFKDSYVTTKNSDFTGKTKDGNPAINADGNPNFVNTENKECLKKLKADNPGKKVILPVQSVLIYNLLGGLDRFLGDLWRYNLNPKSGVCETSIYFCAKFDEGFNFIEFCESPMGYPNEILCPCFEYEGFWYLYVKTRSDYFSKNKAYASDFKTMRKIEIESAAKDVYEYGYHTQGAFTLDVLNAHKRELYPEISPVGYQYFYLVAVENSAPFQAIIFELAQNALHRGRETYINRLCYICKGYATGEWPGYEIYSDNMSFDDEGQLIRNYKTIELDLPGWAYQKEERKQKRHEIKGF